MEKKYIIFVVFAFIAQSSLGSQSPNAIDIQNEFSSGFTALEAFYNMAKFEDVSGIDGIFDTLQKCLAELKTGNRNKTKEFSSRLEKAQDETTVAFSGGLEATWAAVVRVQPDALHKVGTLRKIWSYKVKELIDNIYTAIRLACGIQTERTLSRIDTYENMAISGIMPLNPDIYSPLLNENSNHLLIESSVHRSTFHLTQGMRSIFAGIRALANEGEDADYAIQAAQNQAHIEFGIELKTKFSFFRTVLLAYYVIKAESLSATSVVEPHPESESSEYENVIIDILTIIDEYVTKISHQNGNETSHKICGFQNSQKTSLANIVTAVNIHFNSIKIAFAEPDIGNGNLTNYQLDTNDIDRHRVVMETKRAVEALLNIVPKSECESSSTCVKGKRDVFVSINLIVDTFYNGMRSARGPYSTKSELEIDAMEEKVISQSHKYVKSTFDVLRSSHEYQPQMEPIIQFLQISVSSKLETAFRKTCMAIRILRAKHSFRNQTDHVDAGSLTIASLEEEVSFARQSENAIMFYTIQNLYRAHPSDKEVIVSRLCEIVFANTLFSAKSEEAIDLIFATILRLLPENYIGYQNENSLETRSNNCSNIETATNATIDALNYGHDVKLLTYAMIVPEASAPVTSGRAPIYNELENRTRDIYNAIKLASNSYSYEILIEIENIQERVICNSEKMSMRIFTAVENCQQINPGMKTGIDRAMKIWIRQHLKLLRYIFVGIKALHAMSARGTQAGNKDPFSVIKTAHLGASSVIKAKAITEYEIMVTLFSSYRTKTAADFCTTVST